MAYDVSRRSLLMAGLPGAALGFQAPTQAQEVTVPGGPPAKPQYSIKFAVIGLDHNHIDGITDALRRGGGELVKVHSTNQPALAGFPASATRT
jgi:hypothetical protein